MTAAREALTGSHGGGGHVHAGCKSSRMTAAAHAQQMALCCQALPTCAPRHLHGIVSPVLQLQTTSHSPHHHHHHHPGSSTRRALLTNAAIQRR